MRHLHVDRGTQGEPRPGFWRLHDLHLGVSLQPDRLLDMPTVFSPWTDRTAFFRLDLVVLICVSLVVVLRKP